MNVYDFDETIYDGDSTVDFYKYCLRRRPYIIFRFPFWTALRFVLDSRKKLQFKDAFTGFFARSTILTARFCAFGTGTKKI